MMDTEHGGMPPKKIDSLSININRKLIKSTGQRRYMGLPKFIKGSHNLWVFVNGKKEYCGPDMDYIEVSNDTIEFNKNIPKGAVIEIIVMY